MSNEAVAVDVPAADISDAQVDKYFESGGNEAIEEIQDSTPGDVETTSNPDIKAANDTKEVTAANEPQKDEPKPEKTEKYVPYGALHEERQRRKELQSKVDRMEQTFQQVVQKISQPEQKAPSFDEDPLNALKYNQEQQEKYLREQNEYLQRQYETQKSQAMQQAFMSEYKNQSLDYLNKNPEYNDAYNFVMAQRKQEFLAAGYDENTANQLIIEDELAIASNSLKQNVNPAERIHKIAQLRGFKPSEKAPQNNAAANNNAQKLGNIQKGMNTSKSLSNVSGKAESSLTLESLADMEDEDFDKHWAKAMRLG